MSTIKTNSLTAGAMMAAMVAIFTLGGIYLPIGGLMFLAIAAVPLSVLAAKHNFKTAFISAVAAGLLISLLSGVRGALQAFLFVLPLGLSSGYMFYKKKSALHTFGVASLVSVISIICLLVINMKLMGLSLNDFLNTVFPPFDDIMQIYTDTGLLSAMESQGFDREALRGMYNQMLSFCIKLFPAAIALSGVILGAINYFIAQKLLKRLRVKVRRFPRFDKWYLPAYHAYGLIFALACFTFKDKLPYEWLDILASNLLFIYASVLFIIGLSILARMFNFRKQSTGIKVLWFFCLLLVLSSSFGLYIMVITALLGAFDMLMDFRRIHQEDQLLPKFMRKKSSNESNPPKNSNDKEN